MTACLIVAASFDASASCAAVTVTVCAVDQFDGVNVNDDCDIATSVLPVRDTVTVTAPVGCDVNTTGATVNTTVPVDTGFVRRNRRRSLSPTLLSLLT